MEMPKTLECCGVKPRRRGIQLGYRDEINIYELKCRKCGRIITNKDDSNGDFDIELKCVESWNEAINSGELI